jgi:hypothetical protein
MSTDTPRMPASYDEDISREPENNSWRCPVHDREFVYAGTEDWQDHDECPVEGCREGIWYG